MPLPERNKYVHVLFLILAALLWMPQHLSANDKKKMLILNSFVESEPWVNSLTQPLILDLMSRENLDCDIISLNNALLTDSVSFMDMVAHVFEQNTDQKPSYIIMIGNLAFNMRDSIKANWGDVPMLLITKSREYYTNERYFNPDASISESDRYNKFTDLRDDYNFSALILPDYYKATIDLMVKMIPDMDHLVLMSDSIYSNRRLAHHAQAYLREAYPEIRFSWVKASLRGSDEFQSIMVDRQPNTGFLLSSWLYDVPGVNNTRIPTSSDLKLITASKNPIFAMQEAYMQIGVIGGVMDDPDIVREKEMSMVDAMISGKDMRQVPIYVCEQHYPCINYRLLGTYGLKESSCPEDTVFYNKPPTFWDKYGWQTLSLLTFVLIVLILLGYNNYRQKRKINVLSRNKEFVENMPIPYSNATVRYDSEGDVTNIAYNVKNTAFGAILDANVIDGSPFMLFPSEFIAPKVTKLLKDGKLQIFTYHFEKTDTYYEFILCLVDKIPDRYRAKANTRAIDVFAVDITKRVKMERSLANMTKKLDITLDIARLIPWQYDFSKDMLQYDLKPGNIDDIGGGAEVFVSEEPMPYNVFVEKMVHPDDRSMMLKLRTEVRQGKKKEFVTRFRRYVDAELTRAEWHEMIGVVTEYDDKGAPQLVIGSSKNIHDGIVAESKLTQALEHASESDRMKSVFLASMSHEIRTPLNAIIGFSNILAHSNPGEREREEFCNLINKSNEQLLNLIDDILDLAKIESNTIDINYKDCDVNQTLDHIQKTMEAKIPENVNFVLVKGSHNCVAELDQQRITQIINNLVSNACKFTDKGSITLGYDITDMGMLYFFVRDTGTGIPQEERDRIFERFVKLDTFVPGTGLGLSICKDLVEKMGGEIGVESQGAGYGSTFWFTVPYVPAASAEYDPEDEGFFKKRLPWLRSRLKVLIAEDNESNYRLLAHLLKGSFEIIRANNGADAVDKFISSQPDVVLMDISMPGMDGYAAFKEIRKLSKDVPVIAVTAYVYASESSRLIDFGFNGYVSKPITQRAVIDSIGHALA